MAWRQVPEWVKKYLIEQRGHRCEGCGLFSWLGLRIFLTVNHKDGNTHNNEEQNLELICPNCKSQK